MVFSYASGLVFYKLSPALFYAVAVCMLISTALCAWVWKDRPAARGWMLCTLLLTVAAGRMYVCAYHDLDFGEGVYKAVLSENPVRKEKSYKTEAALKAVWRNGAWRECRGGAVLYFPAAAREDAPPNYGAGDEICFCGRLQPIEGFTGSDGKWFDYGAFMARRGLYARCFIKPGAVEKMSSPGRFTWRYAKRKVLDLRGRLGVFLDGCGMDAAEAAVAKALVLGEKSRHPVQQAYRDSGIVHVLAVSGMHLSVFAVMAGGLFSFLKRSRRGRWLRFWAVNALVWTYALFTGMSPSVCRAGCMFTFISAGECLNRRTPPSRPLCASALLLLWLKPFWLFETGFLLSYAAVSGLVYLGGPVQKIFTPKNRLLDKVWGVTVSSCAAQTATLPFILCSFGTFPVYFLLANLSVTPLVNIALPLGIVTVITACFWRGGALFLAKGLGFLLRLMNRICLAIASLPHAVGRFSLSLFSAAAVYVLLAVFYRGMRRKSPAGLQAAAALFIVVILAG